MKKKYGLLYLLGLLTLSGCSKFAESGKKSETHQQLSNYSAAAELFVREYGELPSFKTPAEFLEVVSEKNRKRIPFYAISDGELGADGQPVDAFGNRIEIKREKDRILFRSAGPNGAFEKDGDSDDIQTTFTTKS